MSNAPVNTRPFVILAVSPDRLVLRRLSQFLEVFGYDVRQATDAERALAAAESVAPDFLIVDSSSRQQADWQLCRTIRRLWPQQFVFAMLLAQGAEVGDVAAALEAGFDDILKAPLVYGELLARLRAGARVLEYERRFSDDNASDSCTGLADQAALEAELARRLHSGSGVVGWLAEIELDHGQRFIDRYGRLQADDLLRQVTRLMGQQSTGCPLAASLSPTRWAVVLSPDEGSSAATRCQQWIETLAGTSFSLGGQSIRITASCGLTEITSGQSIEAIRARARKTLDLARLSGGNIVLTSAEVDQDGEAWAAEAADGKLFQTTTARDVMQPCSLILLGDESLERAATALERSALTQAPVVDSDGKLIGLVSLDQLTTASSRKQRAASGAGQSSVRLVKHVMSTDVAHLDEQTSLTELMEFFTGDTAPLAVVMKGKQPRGLIHCQALAALNERLTAEHFASATPRTGSTSDLVVPDLAMAE